MLNYSKYLYKLFRIDIFIESFCLNFIYLISFKRYKETNFDLEIDSENITYIKKKMISYHNKYDIYYDIFLALFVVIFLITYNVCLFLNGMYNYVIFIVSPFILFVSYMNSYLVNLRIDVISRANKLFIEEQCIDQEYFKLINKYIHIYDYTNNCYLIFTILSLSVLISYIII